VVSVEQAGHSIRAELQRLLAQALVDPTLRLDTPDQAASVPAGPDRLRTAITADGRTLAVMECDRAVDAEPEVLAAALATASLALDNERLVGEVRCQLDLANQSRARLVTAQVHERQRLERDLHDGAQQRLVTTRLLLAMALERDGDHRLVADALRELGDAIGELRDLARGVHPATVTEHGLSVAIESLAERAPLPVAVHGTAPRLAPLSEVTAYFVVAEALTNVAKHAHATHADVHVSIVDDWLVVSINDDGRGGADPSRGTGLVGLRDRVEAAGGRIEVHSDLALGTTVRIELPGGEPASVTAATAGAP
jgi:signal transduction histidine kinase